MIESADCPEGVNPADVASLNKSLADQIEEALGPFNRWIFCEKHPDITNPSDDELVMYYVKHGGAVGHACRRAEFERQKRAAKKTQEQGVQFVQA